MVRWPKANAQFYSNFKQECDKQTICRDAIHRVFTPEFSRYVEKPGKT